MPVGIVLVTGITGYIATYVAKVVAEAGYQVRGTVRSLSNKNRIDALKEIFKDNSHPLELVEANLTKDDGWKEAMEGVTYLLHVASPFPNVAEHDVKEEDVVTPAVEGTLRVLKAAKEAKIKKIVLTSSCASVVDDKFLDDPEKVFNEEDWNDPEGPTIEVYSKSKTLAEKAAWNYQKELPDEDKFDLMVINPAFVMGPVLLESHKNSTSVNFIVGLLNKNYPAHPKFAMNYCDLRDVANAHLKALTESEAVNKRHIIWTGNFSMKDIATMLAQEFRPQGYSIATGELPYFVIWMASFFNKAMKTIILPRFGKPAFKFDNSRMKNVLGIEPTPVEQSVIDMAYSIIDLNIVKKAKKYKQVGSRAEVTPQAPEAKVEESQTTTEEVKAEEEKESTQI